MVDRIPADDSDDDGNKPDNTYSQIVANLPDSSDEGNGHTSFVILIVTQCSPLFCIPR